MVYKAHISSQRRLLGFHCHLSELVCQAAAIVTDKIKVIFEYHIPIKTESCLMFRGFISAAAWGRKQQAQ